MIVLPLFHISLNSVSKFKALGIGLLLSAEQVTTAMNSVGINN